MLKLKAVKLIKAFALIFVGTQKMIQQLDAEQKASLKLSFEKEVIK